MSKRKRRDIPSHADGLAPGVKIPRRTADYSEWGWVHTEVNSPQHITDEHRQAAYGFSPRNALKKPICKNKYAPAKASPPLSSNKGKGKADSGSRTPDDDDIITISDDEPEAIECSKKNCRGNPNCLNWLGQFRWKDEDVSRKKWIELAQPGEDPRNATRNPDIPVGLRNLGATCYANAFLQVWFQDLAFRSGVYRCLPEVPAAGSSKSQPENSPLYQLQVTFAALQGSAESVFNPVKLVESLQLKASEQQDAQEFSKLFMTLLAEEFKKQSVDSLKSLVSDQFEGKLVYGTMCKTCKHQSERESDFLELEVNLENNCKLEDCIGRLLQSETLTGDNKYYCSHCESLQDAVRYTELKQLPPVLHFSLLRFVFDFENLTRKKQKHNILFPPMIDMQQYLGEGPKGSSKSTAKNGPGTSTKNPGTGSHIYDLKGILLHKGTSAYHGHYEAQVFDVVKQTWYQFNDEEVTHIDPLDVKKTGKKPPPKKKKTDDADDGANPESSSSENDKYLNSKEAYMLIYTRREPGSIPPSNATSNGVTALTKAGRRAVASASKWITDAAASNGNAKNGNGRSLPKVPHPPVHAVKEVESMNAEYDSMCRKYDKLADAATAEFKQVRDTVITTLGSWTIETHSEQSVVLDRELIEEWLSQGLVAPDPKAAERSSSTSDNAPASSTRVDSQSPKPNFRATITPDPASRLSSPDPLALVPEPGPSNGSKSVSALEEKPPMDNSRIVCCHGRLDPRKSDQMKRIKMTAYQSMVRLNGRRASPELTSEDVCAVCVEDVFNEKLYVVQHPLKTAEFDQLEIGEHDGPRVWISRAWLKDWRLQMPKFHRSGGDPPPDAPEYRDHVMCEHGGLAGNAANRRLISAEAAILLRELFPDWTTLENETPNCDVCARLLQVSKVDQAEMRRLAEAEKLRFKNILGMKLSDEHIFVEGVPCAVLPTSFFRPWKSWTLKWATQPRPITIDNRDFICEHDQLCLNLNAEEDLKDNAFCVISLVDWNALHEIYGGGPMIGVEGAVSYNDANEARDYVKHSIPICQDCRTKRKSNFEKTQITLHIMDKDDPAPTPEAYAASNAVPDSAGPVGREMSPPSPMIQPLGKKRPPTSRYGAGTRQSKRIRDTKKKGKGRVTRLEINKADTIKDIKVYLNEEYDVPTIYQRLFHRGVELIDNSLTVADLGILSFETIQLLEVVPPDLDDIELSEGEGSPGGRKPQEGRAFGGTLLGGGDIPPRANAAPPEIRHSSPLLGEGTDMDLDDPPRKDADEFPMLDELLDDDAMPKVACPKCTFLNDLDDAACAICENPLSEDMDV